MSTNANPYTPEEIREAIKLSLEKIIVYYQALAASSITNPADLDEIIARAFTPVITRLLKTLPEEQRDEVRKNMINQLSVIGQETGKYDLAAMEALGTA